MLTVDSTSTEDVTAAGWKRTKRAQRKDQDLQGRHPAGPRSLQRNRPRSGSSRSSSTPCGRRSLASCAGCLDAATDTDKTDTLRASQGIEPH